MLLCDIYSPVYMYTYHYVLALSTPTNKIFLKCLYPSPRGNRLQKALSRNNLSLQLMQGSVLTFPLVLNTTQILHLLPVEHNSPQILSLLSKKCLESLWDMSSQQQKIPKFLNTETSPSLLIHKLGSRESCASRNLL